MTRRTAMRTAPMAKRTPLVIMKVRTAKRTQAVTRTVSAMVMFHQMESVEKIVKPNNFFVMLTVLTFLLCIFKHLGIYLKIS